MKSSIDPFLYPGHLIRRLHQIAVSVFHENTRAFGLTPTQYVTLLALAPRPGIDQATLCDLTSIDRSMTARIVETLARRGLVDKRPGDTDRRANALHITPAGRRLLAGIEPSLGRLHQRMLDPLSAAERRQLLGLVRKVLSVHEPRRGNGARTKRKSGPAAVRKS